MSMAKIDELFEKYSEEYISNSIKGKIRVQDIQNVESLLPLDIELIAIDNDGLLFQTKDGQKGRRRPKSLVDLLTGEEPQNSSGDVEAFDSIEAFEAAMKARAEMPYLRRRSNAAHWSSHIWIPHHPKWVRLKYM